MNQQGQGGAPPLHWRRRAGVLLGVCALMGAAACGDVPTAAEPSARAEAMEALERSAGRGVGGGTVEVVCSISYATHGGAYAYQYGRITVKLPAASRNRDGSTRQYRFRNHAGTQIVGAANCTAPATELAVAHLDRFFGVKQRGGRRVEPSGGAVLMGGDTHTLPTIHVNACQYGGEYPYCDPPPIDWEKNGSQKEQQVCRTDCGGGGGGPGGDSPEPPPLPEEEPCQTSDPMINSRQVQDAFKVLWQASNATGSTQNRSERGGWIVRNADGSYGFQTFTDAIPEQCSMRPTDGFAPNPPPNAVGWVHTHPFTPGELMGCVTTDPATGMRTVPRYSGKVSLDDVVISDRINDRLKAMGKGPIPGIVIDAQGIRRFQGVGLHDGNGLHYPPISRCGY